MAQPKRLIWLYKSECIENGQSGMCQDERVRHCRSQDEKCDLGFSLSNMNGEEKLILDMLCRKKQLDLCWINNIEIAGMKWTPLLQSKELER